MSTLASAPGWLLCHESALAEGQVRGFDPEGDGQDTLFVLRHQGQLHGWANLCPHQGVPMAWRRHAHLNASGTHVQCHAHGALFDKASGLCVQGPCLGQRLRRRALRVDDSGAVHLMADDEVSEQPNDNKVET
jgi:nitrite reductase/ring-hydroxylating ferredoxin subunit